MKKGQRRTGRRLVPFGIIDLTHPRGQQPLLLLDRHDAAPNRGVIAGPIPTVVQPRLTRGIFVPFQTVFARGSSVFEVEFFDIVVILFFFLGVPSGMTFGCPGLTALEISSSQSAR